MKVVRVEMLRELDSIIGLWWISWFGILGSFLWIGIESYRYEAARRSSASHFSLGLLIAISLCWIAFFVVDTKMHPRVDGEKDQIIVNLLTMLGSLLALFTLLGIYFFAVIVPRVP